MIVDAIDAAAISFYRRHDFEPLPDRADRLVIRLSTVAKALGTDGP